MGLIKFKNGSSILFKKVVGQDVDFHGVNKTIFGDYMTLTDKKMLIATSKATYKKKTGQYINCLTCGKEFYVIATRLKSAKYCSVKCHMATLKKDTITFSCDYCGKEYQRGQSYVKWQNMRGVKNHFCSISCSVKFRPKGEKHHNWNGGISRYYQYGYHSLEYKQWHDDVFQRDNFTCQLCNVRGTYLHAHHIKGFSKYPDLRFALSNGITLCKKCHMEVHSKKCKKINDLQKKLNLDAMEDRKKIQTLKQLRMQNC